MSDEDEVVITGLGAVTPAGLDRESTWRALCEGRSAVGPLTAFDPTGLPVRIAAEVRGFDAAKVLDPKRLRRSARTAHLAVAAAREAVSDSGIALEEVGTSRVGVVINVACAGFDTIEEASRLLAAGENHRVSPHFVSSSLTNMPACEVAIDLGVHGPVNASALACASGLYALLEARQLLLSGEADVVVCGGADAAITPVMFAGLTRMGALSRRNDDPPGASRPFDADRDGFVFGEGAVVAVLERSRAARLRHKLPYAILAGGALTADAFHVSAPDPSATYVAASLAQALERSEVTPEDLDYICAHGTATRANDRTETAAIRAVLGKAADQVAVSSPKSMVGHLIGAAGSLSAMVCALAIRDGIVPPTINLTTPDPECDLDYVPGSARRTRVDVAVANAFGFGGQNCVAVLLRP